MLNGSIWFIDMILSGATIPGQSGPGSDVSEGVLRIPQSLIITAASPSDCVVLYPGHPLEESYLFADVQLVYSTAPAKWATSCVITFTFRLLFSLQWVK